MKKFLIILSGIGLLLCLNGCGNTPVTIVEKDNLVVMKDGDGSAEVRFSQGKESDVTVYVCAYSEPDGSIEYVGSYKDIGFLEPEGYEEFQRLYGGDQAACPSDFLTRRTKTARLCTSDASVARQLKALSFEGRYGVELKFRAKELQLQDATARDGSPWPINFGGSKLYMVSKIITSS